MHTASWCFSMFLKWKCKVTFILRAQIAGLTHYGRVVIEIACSSHSTQVPKLTVKFVQNQQCDGWILRLVDFVWRCLPPVAEPSTSRVLCMQHWLFVAFFQSRLPYFDLYAFLQSQPRCLCLYYNPPPHLILLLILWLLVFNSDLNWLLPNQKSLFHPCEKVLAVLTFYKLFVLCSWNGSAADLRGL